MTYYKSKHPNIFSEGDVFQEFAEKWGQTHEDICSALGYYDIDNADDILMIDNFWCKTSERWIPKIATGYNKEEQAIADYLRTGKM